MDKLQLLKGRALSLMKSGGFPIKEEVSIEVDEKLPFMGYTTEREGKTLIVVSGWSLSTEMPLGLVIHELSHVYRIKTGHPSHKFSNHNQVLGNVFIGEKFTPKKQEVIQNVVNIIQDLYADDISFKVYFKKSIGVKMNEFFLDWIHQPGKNDWKNAEYLLDTAFAKANLERHNIPDAGKKMDHAVTEFLNRVDKRFTEKFDYFEKLMVNLPENITETEFNLLLTDYLTEFLKIAQGKP